MSKTVQPDFRKRAKANGVPWRALSDFKQKTFVTGGPQSPCQTDASMQIPWERSTTGFSATLLT